jgi:hypothetical protein
LSLKVRLTKEVFEAEGGSDCSLSEEFFGEVMAANPKWRSPSAPNFDLMPLYMMSLVEFQHNWAMLRNRWLSLLAYTGTVVFNKQTGQQGLVVKVSDGGVLLWKVQVLRCGPLRLWCLKSEHKEHELNFEYVLIHSHEEWVCCGARGVQAKQVKDLLQDDRDSKAIPDGIMGVKVGPKESLLTHACKNGLGNMTVPQMKLLWKRIGVSSRAPPNTVTDILNGLASQILGPGQRLAWQVTLVRQSLSSIFCIPS